MTTTESPEATDVNEKGYLKLKSVHGVDIFVSPDNGRFYAKFSKTSDIKWFDDTSLVGIEKQITAATYPFSGHVEVALRPSNLVGERDIESLRQGFESDEEVKSKRSYRSGHKFEPQRTNRVLTGVVRREYSYGQTRVLFKTDSEGTQEMDERYVQPRAHLDLLYYQAAQEYLQNQSQWRARFQEIIDQYKPFTVSEIIDELRKQGARVGR